MPTERTWVLSSVILAAVTLSTAAGAQTFDVKQVEVEKGVLELGVDNTVHRGVPRDLGSDINRSAHDVSLDYGLREWWRLSGVLKFENPEEERLRFSKAAVENIFVLKPLTEGKARDLGLGWFSAIEASTHSATTNSFIFGPILTLKASELSFTANPFLEKTFGRNRVDGIALSYGWQVKYELTKQLSIGVEGFGVVENLGHGTPWSEQEHRIGPAIFAEFDLGHGVSINPDIGVLFGLTEATPDVALKLNIGIPLNKPAAVKGGG